MIKFLLWCILLVLCWPLALAALVLYPLVWLLLLPFRLLGIAVDGVLGARWLRRRMAGVVLRHGFDLRIEVAGDGTSSRRTSFRIHRLVAMRCPTFMEAHGLVRSKGTLRKYF